MKEYDLEFDVTQRFTYSASVKANSPEEAILLFKENPDWYQADEDIMHESEDDHDTIEVVGERVQGDNNSSHLVSFDEPVKLKNEALDLWNKYKDSMGNRCPVCDSDKISGHMFNSDGRDAWRDVTCPDCDETFREFFTMNYMEKL